jgi:hypothetical protein
VPIEATGLIPMVGADADPVVNLLDQQSAAIAKCLGQHWREENDCLAFQNILAFGHGVTAPFQSFRRRLALTEATLRCLLAYTGRMRKSS